MSLFYGSKKGKNVIHHLLPSLGTLSVRNSSLKQRTQWALADAR
ncbi:hypothetical protein FAES_0768 [Fibrella aestuarina BUZ 2]|uniref:Uncharacterized protein n=1 Tax=Fibrella aestuarina BUZ 2 TaxID=1166018 RepID=I0K3S6_9BACT|nr:hypothetical protein FAES_0768 [Fibrella aestuarina BUZ 2]